MRLAGWLLLIGAVLCALLALTLPRVNLLPLYLRAHRYARELSDRLFGRAVPTVPDTPSSKCMYFLFEDHQLKVNKHLAVLGTVFDVGEAAFYGPGGGYAQFTGRDASRNFAQGDTGQEGGRFSDNLDGLTGSELAEAFEWQRFYFSKYRCVGYVRGRFYHPSLLETNYLRQARESAEAYTQHKAALAANFPPCDATTVGGRTVVYCNGALDADPRNVMPNTRYPRQFFNKLDSTSGCACVLRDMRSDGRVAVYENCSPDALQCTVGSGSSGGTPGSGQEP